MYGVSNDYLALQLYKARQQDLERETKHDQLVNIAMEKLRQTMQLPKVRISKN
ncbi:MAG: hypothetical protein K8L99_30800 [Anaerolineae bacterium]|nr:hypothetical protein [Anaerolineae bacterium]